MINDLKNYRNYSLNNNHTQVNRTPNISIIRADTLYIDGNENKLPCIYGSQEIVAADNE